MLEVTILKNFIELLQIADKPKVVQIIPNISVINLSKIKHWRYMNNKR